MRLVQATKFILLGATALGLAAPAFAAEAADEAGVNDSEIIVQARRKDERLQDVPLTVNAVSSATLDKLNIREFKDIAAVVPGLTLNPGKNVTGSVSSMRGLNVDVTASGNNGTVEFYLNDAPVSAGVVLQTMFDVGQIEVLRGPQGTLRGRASPSGSITVTTRKPDMEEFGGYVSGVANDIGTIGGQGALNVPVIKGVLALRVAAMAEDNEDTRVTSIYSGATGPYNKTRAVRVSARLTPMDNLEVNASYMHEVKNSKIYDQVESAALATGGTVSGTQINPKDRLSVLNVPRVNHQAYDVFNWQAQYAFAGQKLTYVGSYVKQDLVQIDPQDKGDYFGPSYPGDANTYTVTDTTYSGNLQNLYTYQHSYPTQETHELRLQSDERLFGAVDYVLGALLAKQVPWTDLNSLRSANFTGSISPTTFTGTSVSPVARRGRTIERSFYGNLTAHIGDASELSGGLRHINYQENLNGANNSYSKWIWNLSAKHKFTDDLMVYATAGSSFRLGSGSTPLILARVMSLSTIVDPLLLSVSKNTPETSKSYEIGLKSTWLDKKILFNVSYFHQDFSNYIFSTSAPYVIPNVGTASNFIAGSPVRLSGGPAVPLPAKVDGVEAELGFRPNANISLSANAAYAKSKITGVIPCSPPVSGVPTVADIQGGNATRQVYQCTINQSASRASPFSANFQGEYTHALNDKFDGFVRTLVNFNGDSRNDPQNTLDDVPAYALVNLYAGVRAPDGAWEITAYAKNVFNTFRVTSRDSSAATVTTNLGTVASNYRIITTTDPREFGITLRYAFGSR